MERIPLTSFMNIIQEIVPKDTSIAIANKKQFIHYEPSERIDLNIRPGDDIDEETVTYKALMNQRKISEFKDERLFGMPYYGISIPLLTEEGPLGCITAILPQRHNYFPTEIMTIRTEDRWIPVPFSEVISLEAVHRRTKIRSIREVGNHKYNLTELEFMLPSDRFIRCHRSYIVNINHILEIHPDSHSTFMLIMKNGIRVPVSQTYARNFRRLMHF